MALAELLQALEEDAAARISDLRARAESDAQRVRLEAAAGREARRSAALRTREADLRAAAGRELELARRDAVRRHLEARAEALQRVRIRLEARLAERAHDGALLPLLESDLARALEYAGEGAIVVEASRGVLEDLRRRWPGRRDARFQEADGLGGLLVHAVDGSWMVDATFATRLDRAWPRLAIELVRRLEP